MVVERLDAEHVCTVHVYTVHVYTVDTEWYRRRIATLTRSTVVAAARARVAERGLPSLSMRSLADDLAVTPMAIYRHVANREGLLDAIVDDALDRLGDIDEGLAPEVLMRRLESRLVDAFGDLPELALLLAHRGPRTERSVAVIGRVVHALVDGGLDAEVAARTYATMSTLALVRIAAAAAGSGSTASLVGGGPDAELAALAVDQLSRSDGSTVDAVLEAAHALRSV